MTHSKKGFTLLEVMIALLIISIALTAVLTASMRYTHHLQYLKHKTAAEWVALNVLDSCQAGILKPVEQSGDTQMLNEHWHWVLSVHPILGLDALHLDVVVSKKNVQGVIQHLTLLLPDKTT